MSDMPAKNRSIPKDDPDTLKDESNLDVSELQDKIHDRYYYAECLIKEAELFFSENTDDPQGLLVPTINELRYAGQHICRTFKSIGDAQKQEYYKALRHTERAIYDVLEYRIVILYQLLDRFRMDYQNVVKSDVIQGYTDDEETVENIRDQYPYRDRDRWKNRLLLEEHYHTLKNINSRWQKARDDLNIRKKELHHTSFWNWGTLTVAVLLGIPAIVQCYRWIVSLFF